jgi:protein ImuB
MLEALAGWACRFTPKVSLEPPAALLAEVQGSLRLYGGKRELLRQLEAGVAELGFDAAIGVAATARAALWSARGGGGRLETLPVEAMGFDTGFLKSLGIATVGELLRLPREGLARRCGPALLVELDRAFGRAEEPRVFFTPPARFAARLALPAEVSHAEGLLFPARRLLAQLAGLLEARHAGVREFTLTLFPQQAEIRVGLASPTRDAKRMADLLRERLGRESLAQPVEAVALEAESFTPLGGRTGGMFGDAAGEAEDWGRLLERLRARLGTAAVHGITPCPDHRPEYAWRSVEPGEWDPREFKERGPRPVWLLEPRRLELAPGCLLSGPERIECGWWDGDDARRDYFIARLQDGCGWVYREDGAWYLHGLFA